VVLWRNMQAQGGAKAAAAQFASTHPSDAVRITALERYLASGAGELILLTREAGEEKKVPALVWLNGHT
jgi:hypothetical protein